MKAYKQRIIIDTSVHFGKPCIAGTRILVENILELVRDGISFSDIKKNYYPDIEIEDIKACIEYAMDIITSEEIHVEAVK